jgi:hypothetical protein
MQVILLLVKATRSCDTWRAGRNAREDDGGGEKEMKLDRNFEYSDSKLKGDCGWRSSSHGALRVPGWLRNISWNR